MDAFDEASSSWGCGDGGGGGGAASTASSDADLEALLQRVQVQGGGLGSTQALQAAVAAAKESAASSGGGGSGAAAAGSTGAGAATPPNRQQEPPVELGFVSPYPDERGAQPDHFPSKVGGLPVWLLPERLPPAEAMRCRRCNRALRFLMQLYCPRPEHEQAYHRSVMLFCCGGECLSHPTDGWRALRCNLPADVPWYVEQPDGSWVAHGREGLAAADAGEGAPQRAAPTPPLPELLISVDLEGDWKAIVGAADEEAKAHATALLSAYEAVEGTQWADAGSAASAEPPDRPQSARAAPRGSGAAGEGAEEEELLDDDDEEEGGGGGGGDGGGFFGFQRRSSAHPEQALRYNRSPSAHPLWAGRRGRPPSGAPPPCGRCGAPRTFEFQLMPQLICAIEGASTGAGGDEVQQAAAAPDLTDASPRHPPTAPSNPDALDWGVVAVYTCSASCAAEEGAACAYSDEYCWHQPLE